MKKIISAMLVCIIIFAVFSLPVSVYAADGFEVSLSPVENTLVRAGGGTAEITVNFRNNPGLWSSRMLIVYPDGLSLDDGSGKADVINSRIIYKNESDMTAGIPDLALDDSRIVSDYKKLIKDKGIETEGYSSTLIYFEPEGIDTVTSANGVLATLNFRLTDKAQAGDVYEIKIYYGEFDFLYASWNSSKKTAEFKSYYPSVTSARIAVKQCPHNETAVEEISSTCASNGYTRIKCTVCNDVLSETELPLAGHSYDSTVVPPTKDSEGYTEHVCSVCGDSYRDQYTEPLPVEIITGDLNGDGIVNTMDANIGKRIISGTVTPTADQIKAGDMNGDGTYNGVDANILVRIVSGTN